MLLCIFTKEPLSAYLTQPLLVFFAVLEKSTTFVHHISKVLIRVVLYGVYRPTRKKKI